MPAIDAALKAGKLSYAKVRALSRVATPDTEAKLLEVALYATGAQLERLCRGYRTALTAENVLPPPERSVRRRELPGGMVKLEIVLSPDEADLVEGALERAREVVRAGAKADPSPADGDVGGLSPLGRGTERTSPVVADVDGAERPSRADAVVALAESNLAGNVGSGNGGERFAVMVHVDQDPVAPDGVLAGTLDDGTRVSAETLRRVACDCGLIAVSGDGEKLDIGHRSRSIPPAIRRALQLRDHGCAFTGCTHDRFLHGHHIRHWLHGGVTSVDNLCLLCTFHHHLIHEGGWSLARTAEGELCFNAPDGKQLPAVPAREAAEDALTFLHEWADDRGLDLGADTNTPLWDGTWPDYDWAVAALTSDVAV